MQEALNLAHRWQLQYVVRLLISCCQRQLSLETFEAFAEAAIRLQLAELPPDPENELARSRFSPLRPKEKLGKRWKTSYFSVFYLILHDLTCILGSKPVSDMLLDVNFMACTLWAIFEVRHLPCLDGKGGYRPCGAQDPLPAPENAARRHIRVRRGGANMENMLSTSRNSHEFDPFS